MKYVLYSTSPEHYFSKVLGVLDDIILAEKYVDSYYIFYDLFNEAQARNSLWKYLKDEGYYDRGMDSYHKYFKNYLESFEGVGIEKFVEQNCDEDLLKLFRLNNINMYDYVYNGYSINYDDSLEF